VGMQSLCGGNGCGVAIWFTGQVNASFSEVALTR